MNSSINICLPLIALNGTEVTNGYTFQQGIHSVKCKYSLSIKIPWTEIYLKVNKFSGTLNLAIFSIFGFIAKFSAP